MHLNRLPLKSVSMQKHSLSLRLFAWFHHYMNMTLILNLASNRCVPFFNRRKALFQKNSQATVCACAYTLNNIDVRPSIGIFHYLLPNHHIYVSRSYLKDRIYITWKSKKMLFFGARRCAHVNFDVKKNELFDSSGVGFHFESLWMDKNSRIHPYPYPPWKS